MDNNQRAVQLRTSVMIETKKDNLVARKELVNLNFLPMHTLSPVAADYGVTDGGEPQLEKYLAYMKTIDERFFSWLEADAKNAIFFANNPLEGLKTAIPDFDTSLLEGLDKSIFK